MWHQAFHKPSQALHFLTTHSTPSALLLPSSIMELSRSLLPEVMDLYFNSFACASNKRWLKNIYTALLRFFSFYRGVYTLYMFICACTVRNKPKKLFTKELYKKKIPRQQYKHVFSKPTAWGG